MKLNNLSGSFLRALKVAKLSQSRLGYSSLLQYFLSSGQTVGESDGKSLINLRYFLSYEPFAFCIMYEQSLS